MQIKNPNQYFIKNSPHVLTTKQEESWTDFTVVKHYQKAKAPAKYNI